MKYFSVVSVFILLVLMGAGCAPSPAPQPRPDDVVPPVVAEPVTMWSQYQHDDLIRLTTAEVIAPIVSPFVVKGEARGYWYFEASFPVVIKDANGVVLAVAVVQAEADWMTEDYVPFTLNLVFPTQSTGTTGTIVFQKDNPSGLPENDDEFVVPVVFQ